MESSFIEIKVLPPLTLQKVKIKVLLPLTFPEQILFRGVFKPNKSSKMAVIAKIVKCLQAF